MKKIIRTFPFTFIGTPIGLMLACINYSIGAGILKCIGIIALVLCTFLFVDFVIIIVSNMN